MMWPLLLLFVMATFTLVNGVNKGSADLLFIAFGWFCTFLGYGLALIVFNIVGSS